MAKQILFGDAARGALKRGIDQVAGAVRVTLGPRGRNVVLDKGFGAPTITNDGVTIAKEIELPDKAENMGAELLREVASKTNDIAGDGTTTATILGHSIITEGLRNLAAGANPMFLKLGIEKATNAVVQEIREHIAKPVSSDEEIRQVASISANDAEIGATIADIITEVGNDGVVTVEESQTLGVQKEVVKGMQFDRGYVSPYMVSNSERMEAEINEPYILITDKKISAIKDVLPVLEKLVAHGKKDLVIIADDVDGEALPTLVLNKMRGVFNTLAVKAPGFGDRKKEMLQDIAILTGATVITEDVGLKLDQADVSHLGQARKVIATKEKTTIVEGKGNVDAIKDRVALIKRQLDDATSDFDREKLQERLAKLAGGVGVIKVGAATETEMKEKKFRIEDAVAATKAAREEGIVPGGGVALIRALEVLTTLKGASHEEQLGIDIVRRALEAPLRQIAENAGVDGAIVVSRVREQGNVAFGFNAVTGDYEDLLKAGVVDPAKVTISALQNAASIAAMVLTTESLVCDIPEEKKDSHAHGGAPGMGGMDY